MCRAVRLFFVVGLLSFLMGQGVNAQEGPPTKQGSSCATDISLSQLYQENPKLQQAALEKRQTLIAEEKKRLANQEENENENADKFAVRDIPVVFHVIHQCGVEQIDHNQIEAALQDLNDDFNRNNADRLGSGDPFYSDQANVNIDFYLAEVDPYGNATSGITYTMSSFTNDGSAFANQFKKMTGWPREHYLNVWIIKALANASGYAFYPETVDNSSLAYIDGIVMRYEYLGTTGASTVNYHGRRHILAHEVGHWLGLKHTWGDIDSNAGLYTQAGDPSNCNYDDEVDDTPNTIGSSRLVYPDEIDYKLGNDDGDDDCDDLPNTCSDNSYDGDVSCPSYSEPHDNIFNMMDYGVEIMFTDGQRDRMYSYLNSDIADRNVIGSDHWLTNRPSDDRYILFDTYHFHEDDADDGSIYNYIKFELSLGRFRYEELEYPSTDGPMIVENLPDGFTLKVVRDPNDHGIGYMYLLGNANEHANINDVENLNVIFNHPSFIGVNHSTLYNTTISNLKINFKDFEKKYHRFTVTYGDNPVCAPNQENAYYAFYVDDVGYLSVYFKEGAFYLVSESGIETSVLCHAGTHNLAFIPEDINIASNSSSYTFRALTRDFDDNGAVTMHGNGYSGLAGQTGYLGMKIFVDGCYDKAMYGWIRVKVADDGSEICVLDAFYDQASASTNNTTASIYEVDCNMYFTQGAPYFTIGSLKIEDTFIEDMSVDATSQYTFQPGNDYAVEYIQETDRSTKYISTWVSWIDFNDDDFYDINEMVFNQPYVYDAITGNNAGYLQIPADAISGEHKMLTIESCYNNNDVPIKIYSVNPCVPAKYGEARTSIVTIGGSNSGGGNNGGGNNECRTTVQYFENEVFYDNTTLENMANLPDTTLALNYVKAADRNVSSDQKIFFQGGNYVELQRDIDVAMGGELDLRIGNCDTGPLANKEVLPHLFIYEIQKEEVVKVILQNPSGNIQKTLIQDRSQTKGKYYINIGDLHLPNGVYLITLQTPSRQDTYKFINVH